MMDELIRKKDAIDAVFSEPLYKSGMKKRYADVVVPAIYEKIKSLPPVQPKRGKWIERGTWSEGYGMGETYGKYWACNKCGREVKGFWGECGKNFCDNCGADMRGEAECVTQ